MLSAILGLIEIKYIANLLKNNGLIRRRDIVGGNPLYVPTEKGIERVFKESEKMKKYKEDIEEHGEASRRAEQF